MQSVVELHNYSKTLIGTSAVKNTMCSHINPIDLTPCAKNPVYGYARKSRWLPYRMGKIKIQRSI